MDEDEEEDIEEEIKDNRSQSFFGRLGALDNRLNAIERRLSRLNIDEELESRQERIEDLQSEIDNLRQKIYDVQEAATRLRDQPDTSDMGSRTGIEATHTWTVQFSRDLNPGSVNTRHVMVAQIQGDELEIMEVEILPGDKPNIIQVNAAEGFLPGENYYMFLTTGIESIDGTNLSSPVQMSFSID